MVPYYIFNNLGVKRNSLRRIFAKSVWIESEWILEIPFHPSHYVSAELSRKSLFALVRSSTLKMPLCCHRYKTITAFYSPGKNQSRVQIHIPVLPKISQRPVEIYPGSVLAIWYMDPLHLDRLQQLKAANGGWDSQRASCLQEFWHRRWRAPSPSSVSSLGGVGTAAVIPSKPVSAKSTKGQLVNTV